MTLPEKIMKIYPDLTMKDFFPSYAMTILIMDNSDGTQPYIKEWNHPTLPQPTQAQLDAIVD
jgi:hypothetical protein